MKHVILIILCTVLCVWSCKKKAEAEPATITTTTTGTTGLPVNTGPLYIYQIDDNKIISISETGTNQRKLIENLDGGDSTDIYGLSVTVDGKGLVYITNRGIRMADTNGTNDHVVKTVTNYNYITCVRAGINHKIYYTSAQYYPNNTLYSINEDGSGNTMLYSLTRQVEDISPDGIFIMQRRDSANVCNITITNRLNNNGLGSIMYSGNFAASSYSEVGNGCFSYNAQTAYVPYVDGGILKIRIVNLATGAVTGKVITPMNGNYYPSANVASDGDRIMFTLWNSPNSSYCVYKLSANTVLHTYYNIGRTAFPY